MKVRLPVSAVVNTHWHDDHVVGNAVYRDSFPGVEFIGHSANAEDMATMGVQSEGVKLTGATEAPPALRPSAKRRESSFR